MNDGQHPKVVPFPSDKRRPALDPRLEELRDILIAAEPIDGVPSDEKVVEDEHAFQHRFGRGFYWNRRQREALIRLKREKELTDSEIKLFRRTGNLRPTITGVRLSTSGWAVFWGGTQILYISLFILVVLDLMWLHRTAPAGMLLRAGGLAAALGALSYLIYWTHIKPWRIRRHAEIRKVTTQVS